MTIFHFELRRNGQRVGPMQTRDCPDCGMAFRAARDMIRILREEDRLPDAAREHTLQVRYDDHSLLFDLPFDLRIWKDAQPFQFFSAANGLAAGRRRAG